MYDRYRCPGAVWQETGHMRRPPEQAVKRGGLLPFDLDTSDILLLLVLYFLYRESGDEEFLIILIITAFSMLS